MKRAVFFSIDETLTTNIASDSLKEHPQDVKVLPGVEIALNYYQNQEPSWLMIGISNQGDWESMDRDTDEPFKHLDRTITKMQHTLSLLSQLRAIYFCSHSEGINCWRVTHQGAVKISKYLKASELNLQEKYAFRKPGAGMIFLASLDYDIDLDLSWMVGNYPEDEGAARNAQIEFVRTENWIQRFL
ncbi:hypothetical protein [Mastigocoleus sp. MO_188.B34]|uniref:hypothetical protein n=1 Tax=Mastigocoleus sp. MO_188.B34 TaxID=3036635 RepID=UPI0026123AC8|nr:hypothetical protein [Mastigocoleus sp. MO_188.B34]MDJ0697286.1 hypothetical protein [Mastigocoleus sp. MO_188.B34]